MNISGITLLKSPLFSKNLVQGPTEQDLSNDSHGKQPVKRDRSSRIARHVAEERGDCVMQISLPGSESRRLLRTLGRIAGAIRMRARSCELSLVHNEIFSADRLAVEPAFEDLRAVPAA